MRGKLGIYLLLLFVAGAAWMGCKSEEEGDADVGVEDVGGGDVDDGLYDAGGDVGEDAGENSEEAPPCPMTFSDEGEMRLFVFGSRIRVEDAETYETYEAFFREQVRQVSGCFSEDRPNLLLFAEDVGLHAGLIGTRGANARASADAQTAFMNLLAGYPEISNHVGQRFEGLSIPRHIFLTLTDTLWRAVDTTFSGIARDFGVWVLTSANVAEVEERFDAESIEVWADPDLEDVESVFVPADRNVYNSAIIYDPDGQLLTRVHKPFLTQTEEMELGLSYGPLTTFRPVELGPARLGIFTSKDAWMPAANDRLGLLGSTIQVQPEAFGGWAVSQVNEEEWLPDVLTQSGWSAVQKYASFLYGAMPVLTGNFVQMVFDGQAVIWGQAHPGVEMGAFVGQDMRPGFLEVGPWAFADPIEDDPGLTLEERRQALRDLGESLLPGAGPPHENAYVDSVVARDLRGALSFDVDDEDMPEGAVGPGEVVGAAGAYPVQRVRLAASGERLAVTWQGERDGRQRVNVALMEWDEAQERYDQLRLVELDPFGAGPGDSIAPAVAFNDDGEAVVVYQWVGSGDSVLVAVRVGEESLEESLIPTLPGSVDAWLPSLASQGDKMALAFTNRATGHDRVYVATSDDGGATFAMPVIVEAEPTVEPPNTRGIQWHPDVALFGDTVAVVWTDFRAFQWDIYGAVSTDGGASWANPRRLDGAGSGYERIHADPRVNLVDEENALLSWTYQYDRRPDTDARYRSWDLAEGTLGESIVLDGPAETFPTHAWLPSVVMTAEGVAAAWMELTTDTPRIVMTLPGDDDSRALSDPSHLGWWPELIGVDDRLVAAWVEFAPGQGYGVRLAVSR